MSPAMQEALERVSQAYDPLRGVHPTIAQAIRPFFPRQLTEAEIERRENFDAFDRYLPDCDDVVRDEG